MLRLEFSERAAAEIGNSWSWYEKQQPGLGIKFLEALEKRVKVLPEQALRYPKRKGHYRYLIMRKFRFVIVFRVNQKKKVVTISSVFHTSRNPKRMFGA